MYILLLRINSRMFDYLSDRLSAKISAIIKANLLKFSIKVSAYPFCTLFVVIL